MAFSHVNSTQSELHLPEESAPTFSMFRRNKKRISCEPCRISKIRCDHTFPTCDRCAKRNIIEKCYYHPAPLTHKENKSHELSNAKRPSSARVQKHQTKRKKDNHQSLAPSNTHQDLALRQSHSREWDTDSTTNAGFFGSTSLMSVFSETPGIIDPPLLSSPAPMVRAPHQNSRGSELQGTDLIDMLRSGFDTHELLIKEYYEHSSFTNIPAPLIFHALSCTKQFLKNLEIDNQVPLSLTNSELAKQITKNSNIPMRVSISTTFKEFVDLFSGHHCRWDFLGVIFALSGFSAIFLSDKNPYKHHQQGRSHKGGEYAFDMLSASDACIAICGKLSVSSEILPWLRYSHAVLASHVLGDMDIHLYRRFAEFVADLFAMGFHRQQKFEFEVPFFLSETRKRIFASAVRRDKSLATYLGRPSLIHRFQCNVSLPLDLEDKDLLLTGKDLDVAMRNLDQEGWNQAAFSQGEFRPSTVIRIRYSTCILRENVLDLSLGQRQEGFSKELRKLLHESRQVWATVPSDFRYDTTFWSRFSPGACLVSLTIYLEYIYSVFQINRMLRQENPSLVADLLLVSMQMLSGVVDLTKQKGSRAEIQERYSHVFLFYGLPSAGVLAYELRNHEQGGRPLPTSVPRSNIIRRLIVFVSWFENPPKEMTRECEICVVAMKVISQLLDEILNLESRSLYQPEAVMAPQTEEQQQRGANHADLYAPCGQVPAQSQSPAQVGSMPMNHISNGLHGEPSDQGTSEEFLAWLDGLDMDSSYSNLYYGLDLPT